ncbi:MAG: 3-phosphoshikimate 1-carboxyvinyltransferase [Fluviicola sp.]|jgi:3-phosphoshikimate 1-carboxyvinyltransferase|uniref:3-phosphoshikimate 1-carboxyvinyltransferase n=1 Tax=Fluviicola sp. TaxID=1917219 RepID=UPI00262566DD|nr:3-phosphoshikimate 1-carboxyvinyltransferase [Fluviicola sp.]MDF3029398.1 3-phosphoshikimate 1-carboxyvinyltransferase [Fluviicola sp.]
MKQVIRPGLISGTIHVPASKSDSQRAVLCAALADGVSVLTGIGKSDDEQAMLKAIVDLGAKVNRISVSEVEITGIKSLPENTSVSAGESGLGLRLLTCVAASFDQKVFLTGKGSLLSRPMNFFDEVLPKFGCRVSTNKGFLPIEVHGPLEGNNIEVDGSLSSQFISGLLMALPRSGKSSSLTVVDMKSGPYIQMTLRTLKHFGIAIENENKIFKISGNQSYKATEYAVESDWSSAAYWLVAAALGHPVSVSGLSMQSLQADKALLNALMNAGCKVLFESQAIGVDGSGIHPFEFDATDCPDLFPALVVLAAKCNGVSLLKGAGRLVHKESNRGFALQTEFGKMGLRIDLEDDLMSVYGTGKLYGAEVFSHHDHRIAMCLAIAASIADGETILLNADSVSKSYPDFWDHFKLS